MTTKVPIIVLFISTLSAGCTPLIKQISTHSTSNAEQANNELVYTFIQPRRSILTLENTNTNTKQHHYYSATGYKCKNISQANQPRTACFINNIWQESAPIFDYRKVK